jgi:hypothetical protein
VPGPGDVIPYPPYPAAGAAAQGALQYALETTQQLLKELYWGAEGANAPALPDGGVGLLARIRQLLEVNQQIASLLPAALADGGRLKVEDQHTGLATQATLLTVASRLLDVFNRLGDINADGATVAINADEINLNTDQVEAFLQAIRDRLPAVLGPQTSAASLAVVLAAEQQALVQAMATALGTPADLEATGDGTLTGILKRIRTLLSGLSASPVVKRTADASANGDNNLWIPQSGKRIRLYYFGYSAGAGVDGVLARLKLEGYHAGAAIDTQRLVAAGQPFARNILAGTRYIDGGIDGKLIVNLDAAKLVHANFELEEV